MQTIKPRARFLRDHDVYCVRCDMHWALGQTLDKAVENWRGKKIEHITGDRRDYDKREARRVNSH